MRKCNFIEALRGLLIRSRRVRSSTLAPVHGRVYRYMYMPPPPPSRARNGALLFVRLVAVAFATPWRFASLRAAPQPPPAPSELAERACVDGCAIFFRRRAPFYLTRPRARARFMCVCGITRTRVRRGGLAGKKRRAERSSTCALARM